MMNSMGVYLRELRAMPRFTVEEEQACARLAALGDAAARQRLVEANLRFVIMVAKRYQNQGVPLEDLVNEGNIGLIQAAARFDPDRGVRFVTYAVWWIRQAMLNALRLASAASWTLSLDSPVADFEDAEPFGACLEDTSVEKPEEATVAASLRDEVDTVLAGLSSRETVILRHRFGLDGHQPATLLETSRKHGLSKERVRQIETKALRKLRASNSARQLQAYVN
jgi:RNA polymerase primary sigma factor